MPPSPPTPEPFEPHARRVLRALQRAVAEAVEALPEPVKKPNDLVKIAGISKTLAWRVGNLIRTEDPLAVVTFLPRDGSMEVFLNAAKRRGVPAAKVQSVRAALDDVDDLANTHADGRASLEMLVAGHLPGGGDEQAALLHRRSGFAGHSLLWGVQARVQYRGLAIARSPQRDGFVDWATYGGYLGFRRLRPGVTWCVGQVGVYNQATSEWRAGEGEPRREPIDRTGEGGVPFLREFTDSPPPPIQISAGIPGVRILKLGDGPVGRLGEMTWFFGERVTGVPIRVPSASPQYLGGITHIRTPVELLVCDLIVHKDLFGDRPPEARLYGLMDSVGPAPPSQGGSPLPMHLNVRLVGRGVAAAASHEVPQAEGLARHAVQRMGWTGEDFNVFRLHLEYPPIPCLAALHYPV